MTIVFDSGVWVSALEFGGVPRQAIEHAEAEEAILLCIEIEEEVVRIMGKKFARAPNKVRGQMAGLSKGSTWIVLTNHLAGICRDPKDDFILECAETGGADLIVTGDKYLLSLANYGRIEIVTPRQYLDRVEDRPRRRD